MTIRNTNPQRPYQRPRALSAIQTVLWLIAGIVGMFVLVSLIFAIKLGLEGRLPFSEAPQPAAKAATTAPGAPMPPVTAGPSPVIRSAQAAAPGASFVSGAENILPAEVAHLAKNVSALDASPPGNNSLPPPPVPAPSSTAPAAPAPSAPPPATAAAPTSPTPAPAAAEKQAPPAAEAIEHTLQAWATAWSGKNVDAYLAHYAENFKPAGDLDRSAWAEQRRQRIARPGNIAVKLDAIDIHIDGDKASARFIQHYRSGNLKLTEPKTIELARSGTAWQIVQEHIGH